MVNKEKNGKSGNWGEKLLNTRCENIFLFYQKETLLFQCIITEIYNGV